MGRGGGKVGVSALPSLHNPLSGVCGCVFVGKDIGKRKQAENQTSCSISLSPERLGGEQSQCIPSTK